MTHHPATSPRSLTQRDQSAVWHPYTQSALDAPPIPIVRGEGALLYDDQGKAYIDAISSWWVTLHAHAHPHIIKKVAHQLTQLEQVIFAGMTHPPAIELAERLLKLLPKQFTKVFYSDNGSTAVEVAIKMALQYWHNLSPSQRDGAGGWVRDVPELSTPAPSSKINATPRTRLITLQNAYHGDTIGAMSLAGQGEFNTPFGPVLFEVTPLPTPDGTGRALAAAKQAFADPSAAAFIYEPMLQAAGGMRMYNRAEMNDILAAARAHPILLIADEVLTGFGRTGPLFASSFFDTQPDCICLSKGLTAGTLPLGATITTDQVFTAFLHPDRRRALLHGHSFTANPLACAAALASLDLLEDPACEAARTRINARHQAFADAIAPHQAVASTRVLGTVVALTLRDTTTPTSQSSYFSPLRDQLSSFYLESGVLLRPLGNVVYILPPYCITDPQLDRVYEVIRKSLDLLPLPEGGGRGVG